MINRSTGKSPFEVVYTKLLKHALDLVLLPKLLGLNVAAEHMVDRVQQIHEKVRLNLEQANEKYKDAVDSKRRAKIFRKGDLVMAHLRKNHFPAGTYGKLKSRKYGPFRIKRKINDNAYVVELPEDMAISNTFNVVDLFAYHPDDPIYDDSNSRMSFLEEGETDVGQSEEAPQSINCIISDNIRDGDFGSANSQEELKIASVNIRDLNDQTTYRSYSAINRDSLWLR
jgi:hypothetical protein